MAANISIVWLALPVAALLSKRHPLVGLAGYSVIAINFLTHVGALIAIGYNPGLITAVVLFLPMTLWMAKALFGPGRMAYKGLVIVLHGHRSARHPDGFHALVHAWPDLKQHAGHDPAGQRGLVVVHSLGRGTEI
jgi:hypothetical protein